MNVLEPVFAFTVDRTGVVTHVNGRPLDPDVPRAQRIAATLDSLLDDPEAAPEKVRRFAARYERRLRRTSGAPKPC